MRYVLVRGSSDQSISSPAPRVCVLIYLFWGSAPPMLTCIDMVTALVSALWTRPPTAM